MTLVNGLTLHGTAWLNQNETRLDFSGTQTLSGSGTVVFGNFITPTMRLTAADTTLTVGAGITVRGGASVLVTARFAIDPDTFPRSRLR